MPEAIRKIGSGAFQNCAILAEINIPSADTEIGEQILQGCTGLRTLTVGMRTIPGSAFTDLSGLTNLNILSSVKVIGDSAFENCAKVTEIFMPQNGVEEIGDRAFA